MDTEISAREAEVLAALGDHLTNAQIAQRLHISVRTVETHVSALLRKLDAADRRALAARADQARVGRFVGVPASPTSFVGRAAELTAVLDALDESRLVTLVGPGGVGKTRLATVVAADATARFPAGGAFVDLVPARAGSVVRVVADALEVAEGPARSLERAVVERFLPGRQLLVLDNCEHVVDDAGDLVGRLLRECPHATILTTSRQRLGVAGERLVHLHPLDVAGDAERLFLDRARAVDPGFDAPPAVVADLCARLEGMPLAIELAAARAVSLGAEGLFAGLDDQLRMLAGGRGGHPRHHSLRAVIGWSYDLLDEDERAMFRRLSAFVGTFDLAAAVALSPDWTRAAVVDVLGRLVDKSLVVRHGAERWRMLDTIRAFGASQVTALGEDDAVRDRHRAWARDAAMRLEYRLDGDWQTGFDAVADDLRAAAAAPGSEHGFLRTLAHLSFARGQFLDARDRYRDAAARAPGSEQAGEDLRDAADAALVVADGRGAVELILRAADLGGPQLCAQAVIVCARYGMAGSWLPPERRAALLGEAEAAADPSDRRLAALVEMASAWHLGSGSIADLDQARAAVQASRRADDPVLLLAALDALGGALVQAGSTREAHRLAAERLRLAAGLPRHEPAAVAEIVDAFHVASSAAIAAGDLPAALAVARRSRTDDPIGGHAYIWAPRLIRVLALTGRFDEAVEHADTLWDGWQRDGAPAMPWMASALVAAAMVHGLRADEQYLRWRDRALTVAAGSPDLAACLAFVDARVAVHRGRLGDADQLVAQAFGTFASAWWAGYARAAGAELAVVAELPDAAGWIGRAEPYAAENDWAAACLARARGRTGDRDALADAVRRWERLDARHERAVTLTLTPDRAAEGVTALTDLGSRPVAP